jgi:hypothetical protein
LSFRRATAIGRAALLLPVLKMETRRLLSEFHARQHPVPKCLITRNSRLIVGVGVNGEAMLHCTIRVRDGLSCTKEMQS